MSDRGDEHGENRREEHGLLLLRLIQLRRQQRQDQQQQLHQMQNQLQTAQSRLVQLQNEDEAEAAIASFASSFSSTASSHTFSHPPPHLLPSPLLLPLLPSFPLFLPSAYSSSSTTRFPFSSWKMNLIAISPNQQFIYFAVGHRLIQVPFTCKGGLRMGEMKQIKRRWSEEAEEETASESEAEGNPGSERGEAVVVAEVRAAMARTATRLMSRVMMGDEEADEDAFGPRHEINYLRCGYFGSQEILVAVDMSGIATVHRLSSSPSPTLASSSSSSSSSVPRLPLISYLGNGSLGSDDDDRSAWSIALTPQDATEPKIVIGTNGHRPIIWSFSFNLTDLKSARFHRDISNRCHTHNIPCIDISSCGHYYSSACIDHHVRLFRFKPQQQLQQQLQPQPTGHSDSDCDSGEAGGRAGRSSELIAENGKLSSEWGWMVRFISTKYITAYPYTMQEWNRLTHHNEQNQIHFPSSSAFSSSVMSDVDEESFPVLVPSVELAEENEEEEEEEEFQEEVEVEEEADDEDGDEAISSSPHHSEEEEEEMKREESSSYATRPRVESKEREEKSYSSDTARPPDLVPHDLDRTSSAVSDASSASLHPNMPSSPPGTLSSVDTSSLSPSRASRTSSSSSSSSSSFSFSSPSLSSAHSSATSPTRPPPLTDHLLYCSKTTLFLLSPTLTLLDYIPSVATPTLTPHLSLDRLLFCEFIPELSLILIASNASERVSLIQIVKLAGGEMKFVNLDERFEWKKMGLVENSRKVYLKGMSVARVGGDEGTEKSGRLSSLQISLLCWRVYLLYADSTMKSFEIHPSSLNPERRDVSSSPALFDSHGQLSFDITQMLF